MPRCPGFFVCFFPAGKKWHIFSRPPNRFLPLKAPTLILFGVAILLYKSTESRDGSQDKQPKIYRFNCCFCFAAHKGMKSVGWMQFYWESLRSENRRLSFPSTLCLKAIISWRLANDFLLRACQRDGWDTKGAAAM